VRSWKLLQAVCLTAGIGSGCAPVEYSVIIVQASKAIAEAETAGAHCTEDQLKRLSPVTRNQSLTPGYELVSSSDKQSQAEYGEPMCAAPYDYYSALEYQKQAREEASYSDYDAAIEFARESRKMARTARDIALNQAEERGR
jgi:hypothetical protein